jgi:hypothetical protein
VKGTTREFPGGPGGELTFDKFHVVKLMKRCRRRGET